MNYNFLEKLDAAVTVCDENGNIIYINEKSALTFRNYGGRNLINKNIRDCHSADANNQINNMIEYGIPNIYSIEKNGKKKLICQYPYPIGENKFGLIELSIELPEKINHFVRE
jgi:transcriptional regulator with PAS, ATPase and Fis domain